MFIDYITLMLINMVAGLFILAYYVYSGIDGADRTRWIPGFGMSGAIALTTGLHMIFTLASSRQLQHCLRGNVSFVRYRIHRCCCRPSPKLGVGNSYNLRLFRRCGCYCGRFADYYSRSNHAANIIRNWVHLVGTRRRLRHACTVATN
jgi:hypothetical protein